MYRFIARENIRRFKAQLVLCTDEQERETLEQLLAAEMEKLQKLDARRTARNSQQAAEIEESQTGIRQSIAETENLVNLSDEMLVRHQSEREQDDNQGSVDR